MFIYLFICTSNFLALIILQPETVKIIVTKSHVLVNGVGLLALASIFMRESRIMDFLY